MASIRIKTFTALSNEELYALLQLRSEVFVVEQNCVYQDLDGLDAASLHLLLFDGSALVGCARIVPPTLNKDGLPHIGRLVVKASHRKRKFAHHLMQTAINYCETHFAGPIALMGQSYLVQFYAGLGFEVVGPEFLEDGIPHYHMVKNPGI